MTCIFSQVRAPAELVSHSQDTEETDAWQKTVMYSEFLARIVLSFILSGCSSLALSDPLLSMWMSLILFSSCWLSLARGDRMSICHLLLILGFHSSHILHLSPLGLFSSLSLTLSRRLRLCVHPSLLFPSRSSLNSRSDSLCRFIVVWFDRSSVRCHRCTCWTTSTLTVSLDVRRQTRGIFTAQSLELFTPQSLAMEVPLFLCQLRLPSVNFNSGATIFHGVPNKPPQFVASQASCGDCLVQLCLAQLRSW